MILPGSIALHTGRRASSARTCASRVLTPRYQTRAAAETLCGHTGIRPFGVLFSIDPRGAAVPICGNGGPPGVELCVRSEAAGLQSAPQPVNSEVTVRRRPLHAASRSEERGATGRTPARQPRPTVRTTSRRGSRRMSMRSEQVTEGPARAPHRSLLRALGISARRRRPTAHRRGQLVQRADPRPHAPAHARRAGQVRRVAGGRHPARVQRHRRLRRHRHEPRGHELLAGVARDHRRLGRDHGQGSRPRRRGPHAQLRQGGARHGHGRRAPGRAGGRHLGRSHAGGRLPGQAGRPQGRLRGRGHLLPGRHVGRRPGASSRNRPARPAGRAPVSSPPTR